MSATAGILDWSRQAGLGTVTMTDDATLTTDALIKKVIKFTGAPTATKTATFPLSAEDAGVTWTIHNTTGQSIRCKITGGAGVLVAARDKVDLYFNGTEFEVEEPSKVRHRYTLRWTAGERGHPCINADMASGTEATREPADPNFEVLGTNGTSALSTYNAEGGIRFTTDTGANDQMILLPHLDTKQSAWAQVTWGTDQETEWECLLRTGSSIADVIIWAGLKLTNTSTTATDDDQAFFRYAPATNSGKWQAIHSKTNVDVAADSGVTVVASTTYKLAIKIDQSRVARFYINDVLVAESTALVDEKDFIPYIGVQTTTTAAKFIIIYGQEISRKPA
jgi:hypothetical protein